MPDTAIDKKTGEYILRDRVSGKLRGFTQEEAGKLVQRGEYLPVSVEEAQPFYLERSANEKVSTVQAAGEGILRGTTGGLLDYGIDPGSQAARGLSIVEQGAPGTLLAGEVAGTVLPFVGPLKGARLLTAPGLLEAGGSALTTAARLGKPGLARVALSRAAGVGTEVAGALALEETRRAHLEARPANYTRVLGGYGLGAMVPALVLGTGVGILEGSALTLGQRALKRGAAARDLALKVPITDTDMVNAMSREAGVGMPGVLDEIHATKSGLPSDVVHLLNDPGPAGEAFRQRMIEAPDARWVSAARAAEGLNVVRDVDDLLSYAHTGTQKRGLVEKMMEGQTIAETASLADQLRKAAGRSNIDPTKLKTSRDRTINWALGELEKDPQAFEKWARGAEPPTVTMEDGVGMSFRNVTDGTHRLIAAAKAGLDEVPMVVRRPASYGKAASESIENVRLGQSPEAVQNEVAQTIAQQVKSKTAFGNKIANELGLGKGMDVRTAMLRALENGDESVLKVVSSPEFLRVMGDRGKAWNKVVQDAYGNPMWRSDTAKLLGDFEEGALLMELEGKGYVGSQYGKLKDIQGLMQNARGKLDGMDRVDGFIELDSVKRKLAEFAKPGERLGADDAVAAYARQSYESLRQNLENPLYWGERAATYQRDMNSLFQKRIARSDAFHKGFFKDSGRVDPNNAWRNQIEATPDSVMNIIGDVTDVHHQGAKNYREHIRETKDLIDRRLAEMDGLSPEEIARLKTARDTIDDTVKSFDETITHNMLANYGKKMAGANVGWQANIATRSILGSVVGGIPGALGAAYLSNKLNPASSWVARAHLERILRQNEARVERAVAKIVGNDFPRTPVAQVVTRLADEPRAVKQEAYQKSIKELYAAAQDPTKAQEAIQKELGDMEQHMPGVTAQAAQQAVAGMRYAYDNAPAKPITTLVDGEFISPVSDVELHVWELLSEAAMDPTSVLEHAMEGELIPEAIDAAEAVAPEFIAELRMEVLNAISSQEMSYEKVVQLSTLFKMPVDMTTDPEYIQTQQLLYAARAQSSGPKTQKSFSETGVHKTDTMSKSDQLASGVPPQ